MHETTVVRRCDVLGSVPLKVSDAVLTHFEADSFIGDTEAATEPTAFIHAIGLDDLQVTSMREQVPGLRKIRFIDSLGRSSVAES